MEMNRRSFITALFSGVVVASAPIAIPEAFALVEVYHEHEHYTAPKGVFNVWYVHDEFWYLLSDKQRAPFEFDSRAKAEEYVAKTGMTCYGDRYDLPNPCSKEGKVTVCPAPHSIDMSTLRWTQTEVNAFLNENAITDPIQCQVISSLLMSKNGAEQSRVWVENLDIKKNRNATVGLQYCKPFAAMIRSIYCGQSYHSRLAHLEVFKSPQNWIRL